MVYRVIPSFPAERMGASKEGSDDVPWVTGLGLRKNRAMGGQV